MSAKVKDELQSEDDLFGDAKLDEDMDAEDFWKSLHETETEISSSTFSSGASTLPWATSDDGPERPDGAKTTAKRAAARPAPMPEADLQEDANLVDMHEKVPATSMGAALPKGPVSRCADTQHRHRIARMKRPARRP